MHCSIKERLQSWCAPVKGDVGCILLGSSFGAYKARARTAVATSPAGFEDRACSVMGKQGCVCKSVAASRTLPSHRWGRGERPGARVPLGLGPVQPVSFPTVAPVLLAASLPPSLLLFPLCFHMLPPACTLCSLQASPCLPCPVALHLHYVSMAPEASERGQP